MAGQGDQGAGPSNATRAGARATAPGAAVVPDMSLPSLPARPEGAAPLRSISDIIAEADRILEPIPEAERTAKRARIANGQGTAADIDIEARIAQREAALAANASRRAAFRAWTFDAANHAAKGDAYTRYDDHGRLITPDANSRPPVGHPLYPYYVSQTEANLLNASPQITELCNFLAKVNGVDACSETVALGRLQENEFLVLPEGIPIPEVPDADVGSERAMVHFNAAYLLGVYVLNKGVCADQASAIKFGLARMEAVKLGWFRNQREVRFAELHATFLDTVEANAREIKENMEMAKEVAWLVPFANEHTFKTKGHHYIDGQNKEYLDSYDTLWNACLVPRVGKCMPPGLLYHTAFHWITPARVWNVLQACRDSNRIPDAIKLRMTSAPADAAIITTSSAVLDALQSTGVLPEVIALEICDIAAIQTLDKLIRVDPPINNHITQPSKGMGFWWDFRDQIIQEIG